MGIYTLRVGEPGGRCANRASEAETECCICRDPVLPACAHGIQRVENDCRGPCSNRNVGKNHMQRMSRPGPMKEVLDLPPAAELESFVNDILQPLFCRFQPFLPPNRTGNTIISHDSPRD